MQSFIRRHACKRCGANHFFRGLKGDLVLLGGFYGTNLIRTNDELDDWLSFENVFLFNRKRKIISTQDKPAVNDKFIATQSMTERFGILNLSGNLVDELKKTALCSEGEFRVHSFGYDWRNDLNESAFKLNEFVSSISNKQNTRVQIVAHSMGGLVSLAAINKQPQLYKSAVFVGTPFNASPIILWALNRGAPSFVNPSFFGSLSHFSYRSSFVFLPRKNDQSILDDSGNPVDIDFWNHKEFISKENQRLHPEFDNYIQEVLASSSKFMKSIEYDSSISYPAFATISGSTWPTLKQFKSTEVDGVIRLTRPAAFTFGDTVVSMESAKMPFGYFFKNVDSIYPHPFLMNDLKAVSTSLDVINTN